jgi:hypothetical protein
MSDTHVIDQAPITPAPLAPEFSTQAILVGPLKDPSFAVVLMELLKAFRALSGRVTYDLTPEGLAKATVRILTPKRLVAALRAHTYEGFAFVSDFDKHGFAWIRIGRADRIRVMLKIDGDQLTAVVNHNESNTSDKDVATIKAILAIWAHHISHTTTALSPAITCSLAPGVAVVHEMILGAQGKTTLSFTDLMDAFLKFLADIRSEDTKLSADTEAVLDRMEDLPILVAEGTPRA